MQCFVQSVHNFIQRQNDEMVQLTTKQRVFVVLKYNRMYNLVDVRNAVRERFPDRNPSAQTTIQYRNRDTEIRIILSGVHKRMLTG